MVHKALQSFNFGPDLIKRVNTFYLNISSCVINNGYAFSFFNLQRGVRQGCPLLGLLFVIGLEILTQSIKDDAQIKGILVKDKEIKMCQYADDTTCFLKDVKSTKALMDKFELFSRCSGLEINKSKTEAMWLGSLKECKQKPSGFKWPDKPVLALGVYFSYNQAECKKLNFEEKLIKLERTLNMWRARDLTLIGKITIIKCFALSKLIHVTSTLLLPDNFAQKVNDLIYKFIWNGKPPKIKKVTMIGELGDGGLKAPDFIAINKALKLSWIRRFLQDDQADWKTFLTDSIDKYGGTFLFKCKAIP